jgi:hypothetical protein
MPEIAPLRQVSPGFASKGCHSSPGLKAWGFLAYFIKVGQKVKSTLTGREYRVKEKLQEGSILLQSEDGSACAMIHKDKLEFFYEEKENQNNQ